VSEPVSSERRRLVAVNLKAYFGFEETIGWLAELERRLDAAPVADAVEIAVLPPHPLLERAARALEPHGVAIGAQDVSWVDNGPYTGEVTASVLAEIGCRYAEVGHADRRRMLGESDAVVADKAAAAVRHALVPLLCVGEAERTSPRLAAEEVVRQTVATLGRLSAAELVVAYEPFWAIGADAPASADHVLEVGRALRDHLDASGHAARILYGGTAGPGTLPPLAAEFDGLFLGRRAHRIDGLLAVVEEAASAGDVASARGVAR
jgi:triosephosphate isomerase